MKDALILLIIISFFMSSGCIALNKEVNKMIVSKEDAIKIANKELLIQDFDITQKNISVDEKNTEWNKRYLDNTQVKKANPHIFEKLKGKNYWAICYTPKEMGRILGGGAWAFIDKHTGEIILLFYEK